MTVPQLPHIRGQAVDSQGRYSPDFYRALGAIIKEIATQGDQVAVLNTQVAELATSLGAEDGDPASVPPTSALNATITGSVSIKVIGSLQSGSVTISLTGDSDYIGPTQYYGSNGNTEKGWYAIADALEAQSGQLTETVDALTGVVTFGLADVADDGTGSLLAIHRDTKGRLAGTRPVVPADIPTTEFTQSSPSSTWVINHNLGRKVAVAVFTPGGTEIIAEVANISINQAQVSLDVAAAGYAIVT